MQAEFERAAMIIGQEGVQLLAQKHVAVFGVGGVGGAVCEALARAGIGTLSLFDSDVVSISNINRQIIALHSTIGKHKTQVMAQRIKDINPRCIVNTYEVFYLPENADSYPLNAYDYVVDAVDTVSAKLEIIRRAAAEKIRVVSAMGAGNKLYPERFEVARIEKTEGCPLARVMRRELKKLNISGVKVVYSQETPHEYTQRQETAPQGSRASAPGSVSFVPPTAGYMLAGVVVRDLLGIE